MCVLQLSTQHPHSHSCAPSPDWSNHHRQDYGCHSHHQVNTLNKTALYQLEIGQVVNVLLVCQIVH